MYILGSNLYIEKIGGYVYKKKDSSKDKTVQYLKCMTDSCSAKATLTVETNNVRKYGGDHVGICSAVSKNAIQLDKFKKEIDKRAIIAINDKSLKVFKDCLTKFTNLSMPSNFKAQMLNRIRNCRFNHGHGVGKSSVQNPIEDQSDENAAEVQQVVDGGSALSTTANHVSVATTIEDENGVHSEIPQVIEDDKLQPIENDGQISSAETCDPSTSKKETNTLHESEPNADNSNDEVQEIIEDSSEKEQSQSILVVCSAGADIRPIIGSQTPTDTKESNTIDVFLNNKRTDVLDVVTPQENPIGANCGDLSVSGTPKNRCRRKLQFVTDSPRTPSIRACRRALNYSDSAKKR